MMGGFYNESLGGVTLRRCRLLDEAGAIHAFTTRSGGFSEGYCRGFNMDVKRDLPPGSVKKNRELLAQLLGYDPRKLTATNQVHTDVVRLIRPEDAGADGVPPYECDALITDSPGTAVGSDPEGGGGRTLRLEKHRPGHRCGRRGGHSGPVRLFPGKYRGRPGAGDRPVLL